MTAVTLFMAPAEAALYEDQKLLASDGAAEDWFGFAVAISGDVALIGAYQDDDNGTDSGSAYVFRYDPGSGMWNEEAKLLATDGAAGDIFGIAVAVSDDIALVGASEDESHGFRCGSAYVFRYDHSSGTWHEEAKLLASDPEIGDKFGNSVALAGDVALIGAYLASGDSITSGEAYVFRYDPGSGTWNEEARLLPSEIPENSYFGRSVAIADDLALIGAPNYMGSTGAAYVFRYDPGSGEWNEEAKLLADHGHGWAEFGNSVALSQDHALIGAPGTYGPRPQIGAVYEFRPYAVSGPDAVSGVWGQQAKLQTADRVEGDRFGSSVALSGDLALIGAADSKNRPGFGRAFRYDPGSGRWYECNSLVSSEGGENRFGCSVALSDGVGLIGSYWDCENGLKAGAAYVFNNVLSNPVPDIKANESDGPLGVKHGHKLNIGISLEPGNKAGNEGDVWVLVYSPFGWYYHDLVSKLWYPGFEVSYQGVLCAVSNWKVFNGNGLPVGTYVSFFGVDSNMNGLLDLSEAYYDYVVVEITP